MKRWGLRALFSVYTLVLVACGGSDGNGDAPSAVADLTLSGRVTYDFIPLTLPEGSEYGAALDYSALEPRPVRGAPVLLLDDQGTELANTATDHRCEHRCVVPTEETGQGRGLRAARRGGAPAASLEMRDSPQDNAHYALDGALRCTGERDSRRDLDAASGGTHNAY